MWYQGELAAGRSPLIQQGNGPCKTSEERNLVLSALRQLPRLLREDRSSQLAVTAPYLSELPANLHRDT